MQWYIPLSECSLDRVALVKWLLEDTLDCEVVSLNAGTVYLIDFLHLKVSEYSLEGSYLSN